MDDTVNATYMIKQGNSGNATNKYNKTQVNNNAKLITPVALSHKNEIRDRMEINNLATLRKNK